MAAIEIKVPANLDFEKLEKQFPFTNLPTKDRSAEYLYYFCSQLVTQGFKNAIFEKRNRKFISLCSPYLRDIHFNYDFYMDYLIKAGVLKTDGHYIPELKCHGYRFTPLYQECLNLKDVPITEYKLIKKIKRIREKIGKKCADELKPYNHLIKWFNRDLQIDKEGAVGWLNQYFQVEMKKIERTDIGEELKEQKKRSLYDKCRGLRGFIDDIDDGKYNISDFTTCEFGNRFHSIFTYLKKDIRHFITYKGQKLVSVDVKNCQPYLLTVLMGAEFWMSKKNRNNKIQLWEVSEELYKKIRRDRNKYNSIMMLVSPQTLTQHRISLGRYKNLTIEGQLYETLLDELPRRLSWAYLQNYGDRVADRNTIKKELLRTMYCTNRAYTSPPHETSRVIEEMFPDFIKLLKAIKSTNSNMTKEEKKKEFKILPSIIQRIESKLIIKVICARIAKERPELYISTIHDSIVTTVGNEEYVKKIIEEVLTEKIGSPPKLDFQYWSPELAKFDDEDIEEWIEEFIEEEQNNYICDNQIKDMI